jgi:hypothetical protein
VAFQHWTVTSDGTTKVKLQALKTVNAGTGLVFQDHTVLKAIFVG